MTALAATAMVAVPSQAEAQEFTKCSLYYNQMLFLYRIQTAIVRANGPGFENSPVYIEQAGMTGAAIGGIIQNCPNYGQEHMEMLQQTEEYKESVRAVFGNWLSPYPDRAPLHEVLF